MLSSLKIILLISMIIFSSCDNSSKKTKNSIENDVISETIQTSDTNNITNENFYIVNNINEKDIISNEKFYIVNNINEKDIISNPVELYDTNQMVFVLGGKFIFGSSTGLEREKPEREVIIQSFLIDKNLVTVEDFRKFIDSSNYITEAEKFGNAIVYDDSVDIWKLLDGATWQFPLGKSKIIAQDNHPVTQVSWNDACAYCEFYNKTLPTEVQWEFAASERGEKKNQLYYWGNELVVDNKYMSNTWSHGYPDSIGIKDGFKYTSPIGYFDSNSLGIYDMSGNVWEWCYNWHLPYEGNSQIFPEDLQGKAQRGGSFLCNPNYCHGFRLSARSASSPESSLFHVGFRCVKNINKKNN